jgi:hypothetical protein
MAREGFTEMVVLEKGSWEDREWLKVIFLQEEIFKQKEQQVWGSEVEICLEI